MSSSARAEPELAAVRRHPRFAELERRRPSTAGRTFLHLLKILFLLVFAGLGAFFVAMGPGGTFGAVWVGLSLLFTVVGLAGAVWTAWRLFRLSTSRLERLPARVTGKRQDVRRHSDSSNTTSTTTTYYVTLELEDGERRELESRGRLYGRLSSGDVGVAYLKYRYLLDYERLEVG